MNMISNGSFLAETNASNKQSELVKKLTATWEKKNSKTARAGGASLLALTLAACGGDDDTPFSQADVDAAEARGVASVDVTSDNAPLIAAATAAGDAQAAAEVTAAAATVALQAAEAQAAGALVAQQAAETAAAAATVAQAAAVAAQAAAEAEAATATAAAAAATTAKEAAEAAQATAEASLATAQAELATTQASLTTSQADLATATTAKETAEASLATLQTTYDALVATNTTLQTNYDALIAPKSLAATTSADNLIGATGNDTFSAAAGTVAAADRFTDSSSTDSDTLTIVHSTDPGAFTSTNIETIDITLNNLGALAIDAANITGVTSLTISRGDVVVGGATLTGNKAVSVTNADASQIGSISVGTGTTTVNIDSAAADKAGHVLNLDNATGAITVDGAATINAASSTSVQIDAVTNTATAETGKASTINAAAATTVTTHADLTGAITINAAKATTLTVNDAQGGATINAATAHTADSTITVTDVDASGATITVGTGVDDSTTTTNIGLDVVMRGTTASTDAATVSGAGYIELDIDGTAAQQNVDIITLSGNGAAVVYNLDAPNTGTATSFTKAGSHSVEIMGDLTEFDGVTVTNIDVIDIDSGGGATLNGANFSGVGKIDLGVDNSNNKITLASGSTIEVTADQTTGFDIDFSAAGGGDLTIVAGDDNGTSTAVGTINLVAMDAAAAAATTVGTVTIEASIANVDMEGATLGAKQNLVITGDEDVNLSDIGGTESVVADSVNASGSSGIITINVEDTAGAANVDSVTTGSGNDIIEIDVDLVGGVQGTVAISSGAGNDAITITDVSDTSTFDGGAGNDTFNADDVSQVVMIGGDGADNFATAVDLGGTIIGGEGSDTITIDAGTAITFASTFAFTGIEELDITAANNAVAMTGAQLAGNATLILDGAGGDDTFNVTTGSTNAAAKSADLSNVTVKTGASVAITVTGNVGVDTITGGVATETFTQTLSADTIEGGAGTGVDVYVAVTGLDEDGASPASVGSVVNLGDTAVTSAAVIAGTSNFISGNLASVAAGSVAYVYSSNSTANSAVVDTVGGIETVTGSAGIDYIVGTSGNNTITGNNGADYISGGAGSDTITGGAGIDTILLGASDAVQDTVSLTGVVAVTNRDSISNFESLTDKVGLDVDYTTDATAAGAAAEHEAVAIVQLGGAGAYSLAGAATKTTAAADIFELTAGNTTTADLSAATDGSELFKLLGSAGNAATSITIDNNGDDFFLSAVDGGNAYIYAIVGDGGDTSVESDDIHLVATLVGVTDVAAADFVMVA